MIAPIPLTVGSTIEDVWQSFESALMAAPHISSLPPDELAEFIGMLRISFYSGAGATVALLNKCSGDKENFGRVLREITTRISGINAISISMQGEPR